MGHMGHMGWLRRMDRMGWMGCIGWCLVVVWLSMGVGIGGIIVAGGGGFVEDSGGADRSDGLVHFFDVALAVVGGGGVGRAAGFELFDGAAESIAAFSDSAG